MAVSPSGKIRDGVRQDRADARFVRGIWLGKTTESGEHLFANEMGIVHDKDSETSSRLRAETCRLGQKLAGNSVGQTCRTPSGKTSQDSSSSNARRNTSSSKGNRTSE